MSNNNLKETIISLGLDEKEASLYLALLELGKASIAKLAKKSGLERSGIYYLLKNLRKYGLVREIYDQNNVLNLMPAPPQRLFDIQQERLQSIDNILPELKALHYDKSQKPQVQIFEGSEGFEVLYDDIINTLKNYPKDKREFINIASVEEVLRLSKDAGLNFRAQRAQYGIHMRMITPLSKGAHYFKSRDQYEDREIRLLGENKPLGASKLVYANKVAQYSAHGELIILLIEHKDLADLERLSFNLAWKSLNS